MHSPRVNLIPRLRRCHASITLKSQPLITFSYNTGPFSLMSNKTLAFQPPLAPVLTSRRSFASFSSPPSYDPLARRPNRICDPYGQGGKPLLREEAQNLLATLNDDWTLVHETDVDDGTPTELVRAFFHKDMMDGAQFVTKIAAVGKINNHYPSILLERRLLPKAWQVITRVSCRTPTLEGLSYNDFYIAMVSKNHAALCAL